MLTPRLTPRAWLRRLGRRWREACPIHCSPITLPLALGTAVVGSGLILFQAQRDAGTLQQRVGAAVVASLNTQSEGLRAKSMDWGLWDPSRAYLKGQAPDFFTANVSGATLAPSLAMALVDRSGRVLGGAAPAAPGPARADALPAIRPLQPAEQRALEWSLPADASQTPRLAAVQWQGQPAFLASHPVRGTGGQEPTAGSVVFLEPFSTSLGPVGDALGVELVPEPTVGTSTPLTLPAHLGGATLHLRSEPVQLRWRQAWRLVTALLSFEAALLGTLAVSNSRAARRLRRDRVTAGRATRRLQRALRERSTRDSLTNLPNLEGLIQALPEQQARYPAFERVLVVADLDRFSLLNSTLGRAGADRVLQQVAHQLQGLVHRSALVGRVGGDKFGLALVGTSRDGLMLEVRELAEQLRELTVRLEREPLSLTASVGARWLEEGDTPATAFTEAGFACDMAKLASQPGVVFFGDGETVLGRYQALQHNHQILRQALHNDRMVLFCQPGRLLDGTGSPGSGPVAYVELLARLQDPEGAHLYWSTAYLEAAEFWGTLAAFDLHMLERACRDIAAVLEAAQGQALPPDLAFGLNITESSLLSGTFSLQVARALGASGVPPHRLCLEITDTVALAQLSDAVAVITRLKSMGVKIALHNFGAGMTSLHHLRELPLDYVKIDRKLTADLNGTPTNRAIVRFIADLGRQLHFRTIAEGVEDPDTAVTLQELGISILQGFLVGRPEPFLPGLNLGQTSGRREWP